MLATVLALTASCTSASGDAGSTPAPPASQAAPASGSTRGCTDGEPDRELLVWFAINGIYGKTLSVALARFRDERGVKVRGVEFGSVVELEAELRRVPPTAMPDLVLLGQERVRELRDSDRFVPAQVCADATGHQLASQVYPVVREAFSVDGAMQAIPLGVSFPILYYSPRRLAQIGMPPPTTPAELRVALERLRDAGVPSAMRFDVGVPVVLVEQWSAQRGRPVIGVDDAGEPMVRLDDEGVRRDLEWLRDLERDHLITPLPPGASHWDDAWAVTDAEAPAAFAVHGSIAMGQARAFIEDERFEADRVLVAPLPAQGPGVVPGGDAWWIGGASRNNPRRAFELAAFLVTPREQAQLAALAGYVPVTPGTTDEPAFVDAARRYPHLLEPIRQLAAVEDARAGRTTVGGRRELRDILQAAADAVRRGEDPGAVLAQAQREATTVVDIYRRNRGPR